jgi:tetratricopeptide (TPR) repeat protein
MARNVLREIGMKRGIEFALVVAVCMLALPAQGQQGNSGSAPSSAPAQEKHAQQPPQEPKSQKDANPFPTDTSDVPVMPSRENPEPAPPPSGSYSSADQIEDAHYSLQGDKDPVASPDEANTGEYSDSQMSSSSNTKSLDSILPPPGDDEPRKKGKKGGDDEGTPKETAAQDISVAKYYLDNKNWRAALSRFQSALVLAPEDPEVYWGLAVSQHHTGDYANARANYEKVIEYDPDSKHAKEAKKALKEPDLANAKPVPSAASPQQ